MTTERLDIGGSEAKDQELAVLKTRAWGGFIRIETGQQSVRIFFNCGKVDRIETTEVKKV